MIDCNHKHCLGFAQNVRNVLFSAISSAFIRYMRMKAFSILYS